MPNADADARADAADADADADAHPFCTDLRSLAAKTRQSKYCFREIDCQRDEREEAPYAVTSTFNMAFSTSRNIQFISNRLLRVTQWTIINAESNILPRTKQLVRSSTTFDNGRNQQIQTAWNKHGFKTNRLLAVMKSGKTDFGLRGNQKYLSKRAISVSSEVFAQETQQQEMAQQTQQRQSDVQATEKTLTQRQKLARTFAAYGSTAVVFHTAISLTSLGTCYLVVSRYVSTANNL